MRRQPSTDTSIRRLEDIYRAHLRRVRWILRARGVRDDTLDDLVHDVFLAIHRRLPGRDPNLPLATWIAGVARNVAFSHRRSEARQQREVAATPPPHGPDDPETFTQKRQAWRELQVFLDEIDPGQREAFVLVELVGMRAPEAAAIVDAPLNTLYSRLRLARRRFEARFEERDADAWLRAAGEGEAPSSRERRHGWMLLAGQIMPASATIVPVAAAGAAKACALALVATVVLAGTAAALRPGTPARVGAVSVRASAPREPIAIARDEPDATPPSSVARVPLSASPPSPSAAPLRSNDARERPARADSDTRALERAVETLRAAQRHLTAGEPEQALASIDAYRRAFDEGPLPLEMLRLEQQAACEAGRTARAEAAHTGLRARGAGTDGTTCASERGGRGAP